MAYSTTTELEAYATARGYTILGNASELLTLANDYIETAEYQGYRYDRTQATKWPRYGVLIEDYPIPSDVVPDGIKKAEMQLAIEIDKGFNPLSIVERAIKREKVDVLETEYMDSAASSEIIRSVNAMLAPYLANRGGFGVSRA